MILHGPGPDRPLTAAVTGLAALEAQRAVVLGCDLPFAGPALDALLATETEGAVVAAAGSLQPLARSTRASPRSPSPKSFWRPVA